MSAETGSIGNDERAADYYRQALEAARNRSDWLLASYALRHLTYLNPDNLSPEEVLANHQQVLAWREQVPFAVGILYGNLTVANLFLEREEPEMADSYVQDACAKAREIDSKRGLASCHLSQARLAQLRSQTEPARAHCLAAQNLASQLSMPRLINASRDCEANHPQGE